MLEIECPETEMLGAVRPISASCSKHIKTHLGDRRTWRILIIACILTIATASQGDSDNDFVICNSDCKSTVCTDNQLSKFGSGFPFWSCSDDCAYDCMHSITAERFRKGYGPLKYYGHWPFLRIFGLEEPASVIFSLLNAVPYFISMLKATLSSPSNVQPHYMQPWLYLYYFISIETWLASAFFHSRKTELASLIDYASALLFLGYSLWLALRRIWGPQAHSNYVAVAFAFLTSLYSYQVIQMYGGFVSFGDHMKVSITVAVLNVVTWLSWLLFSSEKVEGSGNYRYLCLVCQVWFSLAALLELFDFSAIWGLFDAHSLWHAATVPLGFLWAYFWEVDRDTYAIKSKLHL